MGNVRVLFANSFAPTAGDFFDVITGSMIIDSLASYDMPTLANGLQWQRSVVAMAGGGEALRFAVAAVPEPETYALLLAGLGIVAWGSRRNRRRAAS